MTNNNANPAVEEVVTTGKATTKAKSATNTTAKPSANTTKSTTKKSANKAVDSVAQETTDKLKKASIPYEEAEVLLRVENLCQYFKLGNGILKAVDNVSFDIHKGEVLGIVGESGCGKTTTGRTIIKLYDATSGNVYFRGQRIVAGIGSYVKAIKDAKADAKQQRAEVMAKYKEMVNNGDDSANAYKAEQLEAINSKLKEIITYNKLEIKNARFDHKKAEKLYQKQNVAKVDEEYKPLLAQSMSEDKRKQLLSEYHDKRRVASKERVVTNIQMIFQDPISSLDPRMTVRDIIGEGLIIKGIRNKEYINQKVIEMLETVGLVAEHANRYPHEFSGGQRQRIGVARAVIMNPALIIADEPVSALDVSIQAQVINLLNDLRHEMGLTILFVAHDLSVVKYFCDRIGVMYYGQMVEYATSEELFKNPMHPYTKSLLSAIPIPDPIYERQRVRIAYNPLEVHDYTENKPSLREVSKGHFVMCNDAEEIAIKKALK